MRTLKGLGALLALTALVLGIPAALILLAGNPIPTGAQLQQALTGIDFGGEFLLGTVLPLIGWVFWATFVYSLVVELVSLVRRVDAPDLGGALRPQQALAGALVAAVLAIGAGSPAVALTPDAAPTSPAVSTTLTPTADETAASARTHTVEHGDTLWGIAEDELGQGSRWGELAEKMRTTVQPDGEVLTDPDMIMVGWNVELPADAAPATTPAPSSQQDTPAAPAPAAQAPQAQAEISTAPSPAAEQPAAPAPTPAASTPTTSASPAASAASAAPTSAQGSAAPAPASVSTPVVQQTPAPAAEALVPPATPAVPVPGEAAPASESPAPAAEPAPAAVPGAAFTQAAPAELVSDVTDAPAEEGTSWATMGGIGAFAAAGLLGIIGLRRQLQRRRRQPGQAVPMPEQDTAQLEAQLRVVAEPEQADQLDVVQRWLARWAHENGQDLPELFLVRVSAEQIALYLMAPAQLPEPFVAETDDGVVWTLNAGAIEFEEDLPAAPFPSLVTVGQDDTRSQVLLDLERLGTLGIDGAPELTSQVLDAMAVELATSAWSENVTVTLVGVADGLARAVNDGRVRQIDDLDELIVQLEGTAADVRRALNEQGATTLDQARAANQEETFAPEIVLLGLEPTTEQARRLSELAGAIPRLGIAAVTTNNPLAADWILDLEDADHADLLPVNQHLRPQKITPAEAERIKELLATALQAPRAAAGAPAASTIDVNAVLDERPHLSAVPALDQMLDDGELIDPDADPRHVPAEAAETEQAPAPEATATEPLTAPEQTDDPEEADNEEDVLAAQAARLNEAGAHQEQTSGSHAAEPAEPAALADVAEPTTAEPLSAPADQPAPTPEPQEEDDADTTAAPAPAAAAAAAEETATTPEPESATDAPQPESATDAPEVPAAAQPLRSSDPQKQLDLDAEALLEQATGQAPMILMLGELKLVGAQGQAPVTASTGEVSVTQTARCVALAAYLATHPGASAEAVHAAFWPTQRADGKSASSSRNKLTSQTRRLLGQAEDGTPYLPAVGAEGYRLHEDVLTDWQVVQSLIGDDPVKASTPALLAAMRLVRGVPFEHAKAANVAWTETLVQEMVQTICDAAHELVARSLAAGHREHAQLAARVGRRIDPANEAAWRDAMLTEAAAGNHTEVTRLIQKLYSYLESFEEDIEPEDETAALIEELKAHGYRVA